MASVTGRTLTIYPGFFVPSHPDLEAWSFLPGDNNDFNVLRVTTNRGMSIAHEITHFRDNNCKQGPQPSIPYLPQPCKNSLSLTIWSFHIYSRTRKPPPHRRPYLGRCQCLGHPNLQRQLSDKRGSDLQRAERQLIGRFEPSCCYAERSQLPVVSLRYIILLTCCSILKPLFPTFFGCDRRREGE